MADVFTDDVPAAANQISADLSSMEQSLGFLKDCFEAICNGWSDSSAASLEVKIIYSHTPSAANDTGTAGTIAWDADYIYICVDTNTWKRVAIATW